MRHHSRLCGLAAGIGCDRLYVGLVPRIYSSEDTVTADHTEAAQGVSYEQMVGNQHSWPAIVAKDPNVESFSSNVALACRTHRQYRRIFMNSRRAQSGRGLLRRHGVNSPATQCRSADSRIATQAGACAGNSRFIAEPAGDPCRRTTQPQSLPVYPASPDAAELYRNAAFIEEKSSVAGFSICRSDLQLRIRQFAGRD